MPSTTSSKMSLMKFTATILRHRLTITGKAWNTSDHMKQHYRPTTMAGDCFCSVMLITLVWAAPSVYMRTSIRKMWQSLDKITKNEIDYICINKQWIGDKSHQNLQRCRHGIRSPSPESNAETKTEKAPKTLTTQPYVIHKFRDTKTIIN